jgi:hypothetical protein
MSNSGEQVQKLVEGRGLSTMFLKPGIWQTLFLSS